MALSVRVCSERENVGRPSQTTNSSYSGAVLPESRATTSEETDSFERLDSFVAVFVPTGT
jgi:hypothetical protein